MNLPVILVDTHEKKPFRLEGFKQKRLSIEHGDYSLFGYKSLIRVERKSFGDFIGSLRTNRLDRQLEEMTRFKKRLVVVEGSIRNVEAGRYYSGLVDYEFIIDRVADLSVRYKTAILLCDKRKYAELMTIKFLYYAKRSIDQWMKSQ